MKHALPLVLVLSLIIASQSSADLAKIVASDAKVEKLGGGDEIHRGTGLDSVREDGGLQ